MTAVYLDTSLLVSGLADEPLGSSARRAIAADRGERPLVSDWTISEFSSALGLKVRQNHLSERKALEAIGFLDAMLVSDLRLVDVSRSHFHVAAALADVSIPACAHRMRCTSRSVPPTPPWC